jgi:hypothetical protein
MIKNKQDVKSVTQGITSVGTSSRTSKTGNATV